MKLTLIRLVLVLLFSLVFFYVVKTPTWLLWAFVCTYVVEPFVIEVTNK